MKDPNTWTSINYLVITGVAAVGSLIRWKETLELKKPVTRKFIVMQILTLFYMMGVAGFLGWLAAWVAVEAMQQPNSVATAVAGIAGYLGPDILKLIHKVINNSLENFSLTFKGNKNVSNKRNEEL